MKALANFLIILAIFAVLGMFAVAFFKIKRWPSIFSDKKRDLRLVNPKEKALH